MIMVIFIHCKNIKFKHNYNVQLPVRLLWLTEIIHTQNNTLSLAAFVYLV